MVNRKVSLFEKRRAARVFAVLLLVVGVTATTNLGMHASADDCAEVEVIVARGTHEPGFLGSVIGDPLYDTLLQTLPVSVDAYRVNYPADLLDPASLSRGTQDMTDRVIQQSAWCPDQRFILVGYSQGAAVVHGVLGTGIVTTLPGIYPLPGDLQWKVAAVLLFGDPLRLIGWSVPGHFGWRTANYCAGGDPVCGGGIDPTQHSNYGWAMWPAAWFAASRV
ncbi:cutinase family protein [Nocardia sp. NBC_01009]|uniref:cutinase family protein n=1 Tax=unclassified Nocardia TaxID=2637762 RepID=UPI003865A5E6|nr:cutinase family protein [Nocardia sp. NBC_01009]